MQQQDFNRDRYGRPMVTAVDGGKPVPYSRFSSHGSCLEDRFGLERWKIRTAGKGLASRADLFAQIAATAADDTKRLDMLMEQALEAGGGGFGAGLGTALHEFAQHVDTGVMTVAEIPSPWDKDITAYARTIADAGFTIEPSLVEVSLVHDGLSLAGTADRFLRRSDGRLVCADLKTGKAIGVNPLAYAVQLAAYATAKGYDIANGTRYEIGDVDHEVGLLIHVPAGRGECHLIEVDLVAAMEAAELASTVKRWQKRKDITRKFSVSSHGNVGTDQSAAVTVESPLAPVTVAPTIVETAVANVMAAFPGTEEVATPEHRGWVEVRVRKIVAHGDDARQALVARWPINTPTLRAYGSHTVSQISAIGDACMETETQFGLPFPNPDPTAIVTDTPTETPTAPETVTDIDEGAPLDKETIKVLRARILALPDDQRATIAKITRQANYAKRSISLQENPTMRRYRIAEMLIDLVNFDGDVMTLSALVTHIDSRYHGRALGAQVGNLSSGDAVKIQLLIAALDDGSATLKISDDGSIVIAEENPTQPTKKREKK